ncbi:MAG: YdeI/OmpD-associated family protein [Candidatus Zixiibacteriota bacterium]|nr:MAG: YdeI/OmpD-associated family protein [candidate division Zixibacteria bacterium]
MKELQVKSRRAWRQWLSKNHKLSAGIWLVFEKKHAGNKTDLNYDASVEEALCFGWIDSTIKKLDDNRFVRKFTPRKPGSVWSELNKKRVSRVITSGLMTEAGMALVTEAKRNGMWDEPDRPVITLDVPPELEKAMAKNKKARVFFDSLAPSYKRQYIGWISMAKRPETRARRVAESIDLLAKGEKLGLK